MVWIKFDEPLNDNDPNYAIEVPRLENVDGVKPFIIPNKSGDEWEIGDCGQILFYNNGVPFYRNFKVIEGPYKNYIQEPNI